MDMARKRFQTPRGQRLYSARGNISEGPNVEMKVFGHLRRAKYRRRHRMAIQSYGEAITYNLKRLVRAHRYHPGAELAAAAIGSVVCTLARHPIFQLRQA